VNSASFARPSGTARNYYYQAIEATTYTAGTYSFSSSSSIDTYGYLYESSFDPSHPSYNLVASDDDGAGDRQFQISRYLQSGRKYILVVTTSSTGTIGSFSVRVIGPSSVSLVRITPTSRSIRTSIECLSDDLSYFKIATLYLCLFLRSFYFIEYITNYGYYFWLSYIVRCHIWYLYKPTKAKNNI
jgi:hypothetical protein